MSDSNFTLEDTLYVVSEYLDLRDLVRVCSCNKTIGCQVEDVLTMKRKMFLEKIFQVSRCMSIVSQHCDGPQIKYDSEFDLLQVSGKDYIDKFKSLFSPAFSYSLTVMEGLEDFLLELTFVHDDFESKQARRAFANAICIDFYCNESK